MTAVDLMEALVSCVREAHGKKDHLTLPALAETINWLVRLETRAWAVLAFHGIEEDSGRILTTTYHRSHLSLL